MRCSCRTRYFRVWLSRVFTPPPVAMLRNAVDDDEYASVRLRLGVGSNGIHPYPGKNTSTHEWALRSVTMYGSPDFCGGLPVVKPTATRAGMPCIRSTSAIAPENIWQ